ncbi:hypothetical protein KEJ27_05900 [Candidatus Bathyarchaeota archaeon]|nr:hypothetical protein [Candidatus Bathyarchaeota archaeon]MBS7618761.1 hypothetical protein [Candidatus Bathyarchaeota archaeon]
MDEQVRTKFLGDLGKYLLTWHLRSKFGINVSLVKVEGIDLLCRDEEGVLFPKGMYMAIGVRTRERVKDKADETVKVDWDKIEEASKKWNAIPYFAYIRIAPENGDATFFLFPISKAKTYGKKFNMRMVAQGLSNILFKIMFEPYPQLRDWRVTN